MRVVLGIIFALFIAGCSNKSGQSAFIKQIQSDYNITATADKFTKVLSDKKYQRVQDFDHTAVAKTQKMYLKPTLSFALSNPTIDSKLLDCNPSMGTDIPIRIGLYRDLSGKVTLVYTNPEYWSLKHNIKDKNCLELIKIMALDLDIATDAIKTKK